MKPGILEAIAREAATHPATVRAAYAGANVRPSTRRRIFDAVRVLGRGRWPFPVNGLPPSGSRSPKAVAAAGPIDSSASGTTPPEKQRGDFQSLGEARK